MPTIRQGSRRKLDLLGTYRDHRRRELQAELSAEAERQAAEGRYPWKGEFRAKSEIEELYALRRKWDRRFLFDMSALFLLCVGIVFAGSKLVRTFAPEPTALERGGQG